MFSSSCNPKNQTTFLRNSSVSHGRPFPLSAMARATRTLLLTCRVFLSALKAAVLTATSSLAQAALNGMDRSVTTDSQKPLKNQPTQLSAACLSEIRTVLDACLDEYWAARFDHLTIDHCARMYAALQPFIRYQQGNCPLINDANKGDP